MLSIQSAGVRESLGREEKRNKIFYSICEYVVEIYSSLKIKREGKRDRN